VKRWWRVGESASVRRISSGSAHIASVSAVAGQ
jgi:hypothetical protein